MNDRITFNSGVLDVYTRTDRGLPGKLVGHYCFGRKTLGSHRYYAAQAAQIKITDLICIHKEAKIDDDNIIVINDRCYDIKQVQFVEADGQGNPAHLLLTLARGRLTHG